MPTIQALTISASEEGYIQSLLGETGVQKWGTASVGASGGTVNYTFNSSGFFTSLEGNELLSEYGYTRDYLSNPANLMTSMRSAATAAFDLWSDYANITFRETTNAASAQIGLWSEDLQSQEMAGYTLPLGTSDKLQIAGVSIDPTSGKFTAGGYGWFVMMHEIGHALGLKHPGDYNAGGGGAEPPYLSDFGLEDSWDVSIMSYNEGDIAYGSRIPYTPMLYDIAAIQHLYGANTSTNAGDTVYKLVTAGIGGYFTGTGLNFSTRWDGSGKDTLDATSAINAVAIDLREGEDYYTKVNGSYSWNAFGSNIEHARGGAGADLIKGNTLNNVLIGNAGHDKLYAYAGNDVVTGGAGNDGLYGYDGNDDLRGDVGKDTLKGMNGNDKLRGGLDNDAYYGGAGADRFIFDKNGGKDVITDFAVGEDLLQYAGGAVAESYALTQADQVGAHVYFSLYGTTVVLMNVDLDDLFGGTSFIV